MCTAATDTFIVVVPSLVNNGYENLSALPFDLNQMKGRAPCQTLMYEFPCTDFILDCGRNCVSGKRRNTSSDYKWVWKTVQNTHSWWCCVSFKVELIWKHMWLWSEVDLYWTVQRSRHAYTRDCHDVHNLLRDMDGWSDNDNSFRVPRRGFEARSHGTKLNKINAHSARQKVVSTHENADPT